MAKIVEEMFVVKISKLVKDSCNESHDFVTDEIVSTVAILVDDILNETHNSEFVVEVIKE